MILVSLAYLAFFSISLPDSMLGVAWPSMRLSFDLPTSAAGLILPVGVAAGLIATSLSGYVVSKLGVGRLLTAGTLLSAAALGVSAASVTFWQFLISVGLLGLSAGAVDATLNAYAARAFGARRINLMRACYGVGAAVSPLIVTAVITSGASWRWSYVIIGVLQFAVAATFVMTRRRWATPPPQTPVNGSPDAKRVSSLRSAPTWTVDSVLGLAAVAVQTGIETSAALWAYTFLTAGLSVAPSVAGILASGYWLTMIIGRIAFGVLAERMGAWRVMAMAVIGLLIAALLVNLGGTSPVLAMIGIAGIGLTTAPMYPLLIITTAQRTSAAVADRVVGVQAAASSIGAGLLPPLVGFAMGLSVNSFAPTLAILCLLAAGLQMALRRRRRRRSLTGVCGERP